MTIIVYRRALTEGDTLSFIFRMSGDKTAQGNAVIQPIIKEELAKKQALLTQAEGALSAYEFLHPARGIFGQRIENTKMKRKTEHLKELARLEQIRNDLKQDIANVMMNFPIAYGERLLQDMTEGLKAQGLTMKPGTRKSNGELDEEVITFS